MDWVNYGSSPQNPTGTRALRSYLRPHGAMNASIKRDGLGEDTGLKLPDYFDGLTFPILADMMGVCGVNVHNAPGLYTNQLAEWLRASQNPVPQAPQAQANGGGQQP
jgi:hypothetical protein